MSADRDLLIENINALLALKPGDPGIERLEDTLTTGYAHALALEAEQWRLERRLGEAARDRGGVADVSDVAGRLTGIESELSHLRTLLGSLRDRARELRAAPAL